MLNSALIIGIYSYCILLLGLFHFLNLSSVLFVTTLFILFICIYLYNNLLKLHRSLKKELKTLTKIEIFFILLFLLTGIVNLIGVLGPELSFDALWYHLTIPKLFIESKSVYFIKGNLLYYSLWPKLTEMLYVAGLMLGNEMIAKLIHFTFGILTSFIVCKIARLFISRFYSLTALLIFYSNLVVGWLSITALVDLTRSFYEAIALYYFILYTKDKNKKNFILSAILLGLAISTKLLAIGSIFIFIALIFFTRKASVWEKFKKCFLYSLVSFLVPLPYFIISFYHTGNPIYPLFTKLLGLDYSFYLLYPINLVKSFLSVFLFSPDPINPIYLIVLPLVILAFRNILVKARYLVIYSFVCILVFYLSPQTGGGRFIVAYLPALSVLTALILENTNKDIKKILLAVTIFVVSINIVYRFAANSRFLPVIFGYQSKTDFLMHNLNFSFGDFYDDNNAISKIVKSEKVMIVGIHNLYYVDFPFTIPEWGGVGNERYTLIYSLSGKDDSIMGKVVYKNPVTHVTLYRNDAK